MTMVRLGADEDLGDKQNSSKASAYSLHVFLGYIDLIAAISSTIQSAKEGAFSKHCQTAKSENCKRNVAT